jgi:hypothetical protein
VSDPSAPYNSMATPVSGAATSPPAAPASGGAGLRWMLIHMVEETARQVGHLDAIREILDGRTGYY